MYPISANEAERLSALRDLGILDTQPEDHFDAVVRLAQQTFDVPVALISLIDEDRQWFKARCGIDDEATSRETAFCNYAILDDGVLVVEDAASDPRFMDNPFVTSEPHIRFYAGAPLILSPGVRVGTLCIVDIRPRSLTEPEQAQLRDLARIVVAHLRLHESKMRGERITKELAEANRLYGVLADAIPHKVWVTTPDGLEVYRNKHMSAYYGPVGTTVDDRTSLNHPDDASRMWAEREAGIATGKGFSVEGRLRRHDGQYRWHRLTLSPLLADDTITGWVGTSLDIHDMHLAQENLRETANRLQLAQEGAGAGSWDLDLVGWQTRLCPISAKAHGLPACHSGEMTPEEWESLVELTDVPHVRAEIERAIATRTTYSTEFRVRLPDGEVRWLLGLGRVLFDADDKPLRIVGLNLDVTERKRAEEARRISEERFELAIKAAQDGIWDMDVETGVFWRSERWATMLGYTPAEIAANVNGWDALIHPEDWDEARRLFAEHLAGHSPIYRYEHRLRHKDGSWVWIVDRGQVVSRDAHGRALRVIGTISDITARKVAEMARREALKAAEEAKLAAEAANAAKSEFLASMSHEIRTPLHGILGYAELLTDEPLTPEQQRKLQRIQGAGSALLTVVNDVLDFSKIEAGQITLSAQPFSPANMIDTAVAIVSAEAEKKGLGLCVAGDQHLPGTLVGDEGRLRQVLLNLLNNAVKFTPAGRVTLHVDQHVSRLGEHCLRFEIRDTGIGIAADKQHLLFERFRQVDGSLSRKHGGTGLGLAISKSLVELMGGEIGVKSIEGEGSTFWFEVPLAAAPGPTPV